MLLTLEQIKSQLRLDDGFTEEDDFLLLAAGAAQQRTENFLNRKLYAPGTIIPDDDPDGLHFSDDICMGMLLLLTHWYENRSAVAEVEKLELPMAFNWLVGPYRYIPL